MSKMEKELLQETVKFAQREPIKLLMLVFELATVKEVMLEQIGMDPATSVFKRVSNALKTFSSYFQVICGIGVFLVQTLLNTKV